MTVDVGYFEFVSVGRLQVSRDVHNVAAVEIQSGGDGVVRFRRFRLFLDGDSASGVVELDDTVGGGIGDPVGEDRPSVDVRESFQLGAQAWAVENVVAQDKRNGIVPDMFAPRTNAVASPFGSCWIA